VTGFEQDGAGARNRWNTLHSAMRFKVLLILPL
jgi:hypothetical protein